MISKNFPKILGNEFSERKNIEDPAGDIPEIIWQGAGNISESVPSRSRVVCMCGEEVSHPSAVPHRFWVMPGVRSKKNAFLGGKIFRVKKGPRLYTRPGGDTPYVVKAYSAKKFSQAPCALWLILSSPPMEWAIEHLPLPKFDLHFVALQ